ncbi:hyaluronan mediated motility receptor-like isoform X2 [Photinus pyralis]|uniref:hyaluronan mediated motility receptor-like isoform X2 n=1 Tax=Photinus pyralis TaxID=7054 RepID=UPI001266ED1E|nr:hyaluronan mediated motility receptor-like isoform X2 [Photinus pyralis]
MSFPKAKLQRFNEVQGCTPSPADYNVSLKNHAGLATIPKSERFTDLRSPASSDHSFVSNGHAPSFKTPNPPRKQKVGAPNSNRKTKPVDLFAITDDAEALKEKIVECNNKDLFIQELTEHVEELKQDLNDLQSVISKLTKRNSSLELNVEKLSDDHSKTLTELTKKRELEVVLVKKKALEEESVEELSNLLKCIGVLQNLLDLLRKNTQMIIAEQTEELILKNKQIYEFEKSISQLKALHLQEIQTLESDMLKTVSNMHNIIDNEKENGEKRVNEVTNAKEQEIGTLKEKFDKERLKLIEDYEMKIQQMKENFKEATILTEIQTREKCETIESSWKAKVEEVQLEADAILKECQAIAEYNIIQSEIEKNKVSYELTEEKKKVEELRAENLEMKSSCAVAETKRKEIETQLSNVIIELNTIREELGKEITECKENVRAATKDKNLYELTVQKTHKTVEALKRRLMKSDQDVEQLKAELEATEESKLEVEGKCNQLMHELEIVTDLCDIIEEQNKMTVDLAEQKVLQLKEELCNKIDDFKSKSKAEIKLKEDELNKVKKDLSEARELLHDQNILNCKAQEWISLSQDEIKQCEVLEKKLLASEDSRHNLLKENSKLKTVIELMQASENDLLKQISDLKNCEPEPVPLPGTDDDLKEKYGKLLEQLESVEKDNAQLRMQVAEQNALIGPFRDNLKSYEMEYNILMNEKEHAEKEAHEMGLKYVEILGHQNLKQKIKHLVDLKKKNAILTEEKQKLEVKLRNQARTIENLKSQVSTPKKSSKKDKENLDHSSGRIESPGPLRDRN